MSVRGRSAPAISPDGARVLVPTEERGSYPFTVLSSRGDTLLRKRYAANGSVRPPKRLIDSLTTQYGGPLPPMYLSSDPLPALHGTVVGSIWLWRWSVDGRNT